MLLHFRDVHMNRTFFLVLVYACVFVFMQTRAYAAAGVPLESETRPVQRDAESYRDVDNVDPATGNLVIRHNDIDIPGNGGMNINVWRTYDMLSASAGLSATHTQSYEWTALGPGWTLTAAPKIYFDGKFDVYVSADKRVMEFGSFGFSRLCAGSAPND
jgi:hypothetical protein